MGRANLKDVDAETQIRLQQLKVQAGLKFYRKPGACERHPVFFKGLTFWNGKTTGFLSVGARAGRRIFVPVHEVKIFKFY
jgi:hypothetical protein